MSELSHIGEDGAARMVDVSEKDVTRRDATAVADVRMSGAGFDAVAAGDLKKGDVLGTARIAGIMAAKRTADLIPLCHPLPIERVAVELSPDADLPGIRIRATVRTTGRTGVEMEALTAASVAALTVHDMAKAVDKTMVIENLRVVEKSGGRSGDWKINDT